MADDARPQRQGRAWTEDECADLIAEIREGLGVDVIAARHDRTTTAIGARAARLIPRSAGVDRHAAIAWLRSRLSHDSAYDWRSALAEHTRRRPAVGAPAPRRSAPAENASTACHTGIQAAPAAGPSARGPLAKRPDPGTVPTSGQSAHSERSCGAPSTDRAVPRAAAPRLLQGELRQLVSTLTRVTGLTFGGVNQRLNAKLGVPTRAGADEALLQRAVNVAQEWLQELEGPERNHEAPEPVSVGRAPVVRRAPGPKPTAEQDRAVEVFAGGEHLVLQAGAGTGKTTTLTMLARSVRKRGRYIAFNKPVAMDAAAKFPDNVACRTAHSLAHEAVGRRYQDRLDSPRQPGWVMGQALGIAPTMVVRLGERRVTNRALSYVVFETVKRFCYSADAELGRRHVPGLRGLDDALLHGQLVDLALPFARRAWEDLQNPNEGVVRFTHDHYLKLWALQKPVIRADFLLLDEAQDTNPVVEEVFTAQRDHAQLVMVGDSAQAIYGWRGARDVMTGFEGHQLSLSQSFRFGPCLAHEANRWLTIVDAPIRLQGSPELVTDIGPLKDPDAILCRTNGGAIEAILHLLEAKRRVAFVGGGGALAALAKAASDLKEGRRTSHPELVLFKNWADLQEYVTYDPAGHDLAPLVDVIDEYGADVILDAVSRLDDEAQADVAVSTAHKAKGREWPTVQIARDFEPAPSDTFDAHGKPVPGDLNIPEARLSYVAVTRARQRLDLGGLSWINDHPKNPPTYGLPAAPGLNPHLPRRSDPGSSDGQATPWDRLGPPPAAEGI
ncbi:UvrD-helicase domain-containing protein [Streptomyces sp. NPDC047049]|uniref:UvrD-helicase domain-containing protein n=1 Tax=Streptomyces sp. NPDC047049 TaxID=3156688 RepID=UPI0033D6DDC4